MNSDSVTGDVDKKCVFNKVKYQFLAALCGNYDVLRIIGFKSSFSCSSWYELIFITHWHTKYKLKNPFYFITPRFHII